MTDDKSPPAPRQWVRTWVREEEFWRDVTSRGLAGIIVASLGYFHLLLSGSIGVPNIWRALASLALTACA